MNSFFASVGSLFGLGEAAPKNKSGNSHTSLDSSHGIDTSGQTEWISHLIRIFIKSVDCERLFKRLLQKKAEKLKISNVVVTDFSLNNYPHVCGSVKYKEHPTDALDDTMQLSVPVEGLQCSITVECIYMSFPLKLAVEIESLKGVLLFRLSPNVTQLKFTESPKMTLKIRPFLDDVHLNISLLKSAIHSAITNAIHTELVEKWWRQNYLTKSSHMHKEVGDDHHHQPQRVKNMSMPNIARKNTLKAMRKTSIQKTAKEKQKVNLTV